MQILIDTSADSVQDLLEGAPPDLPSIAARQPDRLRRMVCGLAHGVIEWPVAVWGALDVIVAFGGFILAHYLSPQFDFAAPRAYNIGTTAFVFSTFLFCFCYALGLYDRHNFAWIGRIVRSAILANILALAITSLLFGSLGFVKIGRLVLLNAFAVSVAGTILLRIAARSAARLARIRVMFIGSRRKFRPVATGFRRLYRGFYDRPVYLQRPHGSSVDRASYLLEAVRQHRPDEIVVEDDDAAILDLLRQSSAILRFGCEIRSHAAYHEDLLGQVPIATIDHRGLLGDGLRIARYGSSTLIKRLLDVILSAFGLMIGTPIMLLCAALVKLTSTGPVVYSQVRVGQYGRPFVIYKFRTMCNNAESNGAQWATEGDERITTLGRVLRKTRFDELPQLWNILRGDMSFVGPRPERPEFVSQLRQHIPYYDLRHLVPPGLTGWAQVRYRYGASVEDAQHKLAYDLYYVRHYSPSFDLAICLRTLVAMAKGAR